MTIKAKCVHHIYPLAPSLASLEAQNSPSSLGPHGPQSHAAPHPPPPPPLRSRGGWQFSEYPHGHMFVAAEL